MSMRDSSAAFNGVIPNVYIDITSCRLRVQHDKGISNTVNVLGCMKEMNVS